MSSAVRTGATADRLALAERVRELRDGGQLQREISVRLGISRQYAAALLTDPDGSRERARKDGYRGVCEICGAATTGCYGRGKAPTRCHKHNRGAEIQRERRGTGPLQTWIVGLLRANGPMRMIDIAAASGTTTNTTAVTLLRMLQRGYVERVSRGVYRA